MENVGETQSYRFIDHVESRAVRVLSRMVGVKTMTRPFWNRWRASLLDDDTIMQFLRSIDSIDDWARASMQIVEQEERHLRVKRRSTPAEQIAALRRLSYLCVMAQWGCLPITPEKVAIYERARDYYVAAESLAFGDRFRRVPIPWRGRTFWGNLHLPQDRPPPFPVIVVIHGMDDSKEEHLATELAIQARGFAAFGFDGPGQAEALLCDGWTWPTDYEDAASQALSVLIEEHDCDANAVGVIGISWGAMWSIKTAAHDPRIKAVYDLGGPIDARQFRTIPYFLKTRFCQVFGVSGPSDMEAHLDAFAINDLALLKDVRCAVRIVHGGKDPLVPVRDKAWLRDALASLHPEQDVTLVIYPDGDHCCTGQAEEIRRDGAAFFERVLGTGR